AAAIATGLLFGIAPAWQAATTDLNTVLKDAARGTSGGVRPQLRKALAAAELALATRLLGGAVLLGPRLLPLQRVQIGFDPGGLLTFQISLPASKYPRPKNLAFYHDLLERLRATPGIRDAAVSSGIPFGVGNYTTSPLTVDGSPVLPVGTAIPIDWRLVSDGFIRTMRIPLLRGRDFTDSDGAATPPSAIVSQATARRV